MNKLASIYNRTKTFNPFLIAEHEGIEYKYVEASSEFEGQTSNVLGKPLIILNSSLIDSPKKFVVMAHEVCHVLLHNGLISYYTLGSLQQSKMEYEANKFTSILLINFFVEHTGDMPDSFQAIKSAFMLEDDYEKFYFDWRGYYSLISKNQYMKN